ncbi:glycoside hydrolase family 131 protein, partial [Aureobasidium melanogenum]
MYFNSIALTTVLLAGSSMAEIIWDGRFTDKSAAEIDKWSWNNQVGAYQYYIHGSGATTDYINISPDYVNPADSSSADGARITVDGTSSWNGQTMMRTELIPSTKAAINKGKKYYHFSLKRGTENAPDTTAEHQVAFFESHFTELKYGVDGSDGKLQWMTDGKSQFDMDFEADVWHNVAYGIDFDASTVEFFHSTGADKLVSKAGPMKASVSSNGADWHVGVLKFSKTKEDWFFSSVYIEDGELTTSISASGGDAPAKASSAPAASSSTTAVSSKAPVVAPSSSAAAAQTTSSKAASSSATTVKSSVSAVPTTLQTMTKPTSSAASVISSTAAAETAPSATDDAGCTVEYVYV